MYPKVNTNRSREPQLNSHILVEYCTISLMRGKAEGGRTRPLFKLLS